MSRTHWTATALATGAGLAISGAAIAGSAYPVSVVLKQGDTVGTSTVASLNTPFVDGNGKVGFVGALADARRFVWWDTGPVFFSDDFAPDALTGGESTMGISNTGNFLYSPSFNGFDSVVNASGKVVADEDPAPALPGQFIVFASRPRMAPDGTMYWVSGTSTTQGGSTSKRILYKADPTGTTFTPIYEGGVSSVGGTPLAAQGIDFDYEFSNDNAHHISVLDLATGSAANNIHVVMDGGIKAQEGGATGDGDNWMNFDTVGVNTAGDWIVTGDTDGATTSDEVIAYNGVIGMREGDVIDGVAIPSGASVNAASIADDGTVASIWTVGSTFEALFWGPGNSMENSLVVLQRGDLVDGNNDMIADYTIADFNASGVIGPGLEHFDNGLIYVEVDLTPLAGGADIEAIICVQVPAPASLAVLGLAPLAVLRRRR